MTWDCPECDTENDLDPALEEGQIVECIECGCEFEVTRLDPLRLQEITTAGAEETSPDGDDDPWDD